MQEILSKRRYFERGFSKSLKKVNFIFPLERSPCKWTRSWKTKMVRSYWPVALHVIKQVQKNSFISDVLPDKDWWRNIKRFLIIPKITSEYLCEPIHDIINYSILICPFSSGKREKERKKITKEIEYLQNKKCCLDKKHFSQFMTGYHLVKK